MLRELRDALRDEGGRPVRVEVVARRLGTDVATVTAMLEHQATRALIGATSAPAVDPDCAPNCHSASRACRHCALRG